MEVFGLSLVDAGLAAAEHEIDSSTERGLESGAERIRTAWQEGIASEGLILTGRYHDSIAVVRDGEEVKVVSDVPYAPILEHGDSRQEAHPVAQRALEEHGAEALDDIGDHLRTVLR